MSKLFWDPRLRTRRKPPAFTSEPKSAAAQLLRRRGGGRAFAKDESVDLFSALRNHQPDRRVSGQPDREGRPGGGGGRWRGDDDELLPTVIGKHDYDWLLSPPGTPLWSPATSAAATAGRKVSAAAVPDRLARRRSASHAKTNSPLSLTRPESGTPTSGLARSSSAARPAVNTPTIASSGRPPHVRTLSSASSSSINTATSNVSVSSTPLRSAATSPRMPAAARSRAAAAALCRRRDNAQPRQSPVYTARAAAESKSKAAASSKPGPSTPTSARPRAATTGASSQRSASAAAATATEQAAPIRRGANALARSRFAGAAGSTARLPEASPAPQGVARTDSKLRPTPAAAKQHHGNGLPALSTTTLRWQPSTAAANRSSRNSGGGRKVVDEKATPRRTSGLASAAVSGGLTRNGSTKPTSSDAKHTAINENDGGRYQDARHVRSVASRSRLGFTAVTSEACSAAGRRSPAEKEGKVTARIAAPDAFPSTRYDAMLLREDPKNLTWLHGYSGEDDGGVSVGGASFVLEGSVELFDLPAGMGGTVVPPKSGEFRWT